MLNNLDTFLGFYSERTNTLDNEANDIQKKLTSLDEEISVIWRNLQEVSRNDKATSMSREVSILLEANESGEVELDLSYVVRNAFWTPSYDLRVSTEDNSLKVNYYGLIQQNTNEEWTDAQLSLSTAMPSVGGQIPEPSTLKVGLYKPPASPQYYYGSEDREGESPAEGAKKSKKGYKKGRSKKSRRGGKAVKEGEEAKEGETAKEDNECTEGGTLQEIVKIKKPVYMERATTTAKENVTCTSFEIKYKTTIPSDTTSHKVIIAEVDLKPSLEYESVPSKSLFAYLEAKVINTSTYPFLPGPTSIFLDKSFVAKGHLKAVSPAEEFSCSLGVDPAIRIEHKPSRKYNQESGYISKSSVINREQTIEVKNTKFNPIKIKVVEQLPLSSDEKLKIVLVEPNAQTPKLSFRINKQNNVEWDLVIAANETRHLVLKYYLEYPKGEQLEFKQEY